MRTLHERIAEALGWTEAETWGFSLAALRELLPPGALRDEVSQVIERGDWSEEVTG